MENKYESENIVVTKYDWVRVAGSQTIRGDYKVEFKTIHNRIDIWYPEIQNEEKSTLIVGIEHTRGIDNIRIYFDGNEN